MLTRLFRSPRARRPARTRAAPPRFRPRLEALEERAVPAQLEWAATGTASSWFTASNWKIGVNPAGRYPLNTDDVVFDGTLSKTQCSVNSLLYDGVCMNMTFTGNYGNGVIVNSTHDLHVYGNLNMTDSTMGASPDYIATGVDNWVQLEGDSTLSHGALGLVAGATTDPNKVNFKFFGDVLNGLSGKCDFDVPTGTTFQLAGGRYDFSGNQGGTGTLNEAVTFDGPGIIGPVGGITGGGTVQLILDARLNLHSDSTTLIKSDGSNAWAPLDFGNSGYSTEYVYCNSSTLTTDGGSALNAITSRIPWWVQSNWTTTANTNIVFKNHNTTTNGFSLYFAGGTYTDAAGALTVGNDGFQVAGGTMNVAGTLRGVNNSLINGGTVNLTGAGKIDLPTPSTTLTISAGTLTAIGTGTVMVAAPTVNASAGTIQVGDATHTSGILEFTGDFIWSGASLLVYADWVVASGYSQLKVDGNLTPTNNRFVTQQMVDTANAPTTGTRSGWIPLHVGGSVSGGVGSTVGVEFISDTDPNDPNTWHVAGRHYTGSQSGTFVGGHDFTTSEANVHFIM